jgi:hypothetical protein
MKLPLTRLNSEPAAIFTPPPWFYQKYFCFSKFLQFFFERQQTNMKTPRKLGKGDI